jgi:hypothetical protein
MGGRVLVVAAMIAAPDAEADAPPPRRITSTEQPDLGGTTLSTRRHVSLVEPSRAEAFRGGCHTQNSTSLVTVAAMPAALRPEFAFRLRWLRLEGAKTLAWRNP